MSFKRKCNFLSDAMVFIIFVSLEILLEAALFYIKILANACMLVCECLIKVLHTNYTAFLLQSTCFCSSVCVFFWGSTSVSNQAVVPHIPVWELWLLVSHTFINRKWHATWLCIMNSSYNSTRRMFPLFLFFFHLFRVFCNAWKFLFEHFPGWWVRVFPSSSLLLASWENREENEKEKCCWLTCVVVGF